MKIINLIAIMAVCAVAGAVHAQEIVTTGDIVAGSRALGMGGAQIAGANDVSAAFNNPAALTRLSEIEFQLGLIRLGRKIETSLRSDGFNASGSPTEDYTGLGSIGVAYPVPTQRGSLVFALAYNRVKDFNGSFYMKGFNDYAFETENDLWGGWETDEIIEDGGMGVVSLAGAVDVSPNLAFGLSIDIWDGSYSIDKRVLKNDFDGGVSWLDVTGGEDDITGWSVKPSILYFQDQFRLGGFIRLPMTFKIDQDNYEDYYSRNDGQYFALHENIDPSSGYAYLDDSYTSSASYEIKAPMQLGAGVSFGEPGIRSIAADVTYENWENAEFDDEYDPHYFRDKYRSSLGWRVGAEYMLPRIGTVVRVGYMHQPLIFKGPRVSAFGEPEIEVEDDRNFVTVGLSKYIDNSLRLDFGYAQGTYSTREGSRTDEETLTRFYATISYSMPLITRGIR